MVQLDSSGPMVRNVQIEETVILIMCSRKSYEKNTQHKRQIGRCNCILSQKNIKLQTVPPSMPLEALLILDNLTDSDSNGIDGGTGYNFITQVTDFSLESSLVTFKESNSLLKQRIRLCSLDRKLSERIK